jgi:hypothetical protein
MKVAVIGSRSFDNYDLLDVVLSEEPNISLIISGGAKGADSLAKRFAEDNNIPCKVIEANWSDLTHEDALIKEHPDGRQYDARAGFRRNFDIINEADKVIVFWDGTSKGTLDSLTKAKKLKKQIKIIKYLLM